MGYTPSSSDRRQSSIIIERLWQEKPIAAAATPAVVAVAGVALLQWIRMNNGALQAKAVVQRTSEEAHMNGIRVRPQRPVAKAVVRAAVTVVILARGALEERCAVNAHLFE